MVGTVQTVLVEGLVKAQRPGPSSRGAPRTIAMGQLRRTRRQVIGRLRRRCSITEALSNSVARSNYVALAPSSVRWLVPERSRSPSPEGLSIRHDLTATLH